MRKKKWQTADRKASDIVKQLLYNRGVVTRQAQEEFLSPEKPSLPFILSKSNLSKNSLKKAINRIVQAIENKEKIIVYGDYDADGITGTSILWETIFGNKADCLPYIPDRENEGYGLNLKAVKKFIEEKVKLIITVDCGITNCAEIAYAQKHGIDVIVTDHHEKGKKEVDALVVIHETSLVGASIAWTLATALKEHIGKFSGKKTKDLDLAAIGTIADLQPLTGLNRSFAFWGLKEMNSTSRLGLQQLCSEVGLVSGKINAYHIGYVISPRLNASGRLHTALDAMRLLCSRDTLQVAELSQVLSKLNSKRQNMTTDSYEMALKQVENREKQKILIVSHKEWHEGIVGLIASKVKEEYYRPTIAMSLQGDLAKASARSIPGFNIIAALREVESLLIDCGGHPMAAGFTIASEKIPLFTSKLEKIASTKITDDMLTPVLSIDAELSLQEISWGLKRSLSTLEPCGAGNPEPLFLMKGVTVTFVNRIGKEKSHLKFQIKSETCSPKITFEVLGFGMGDRYQELNVGTKIDLVFSVDENEWQGIKSLILKAKDFVLSAS